jgi:hypothetical protein
MSAIDLYRVGGALFFNSSQRGRMSDPITTKAEAGADDKRSSKPSTGGRGYNARAGETIAGNLARGGDGKFTSAGNASAAKPTTGRRAVDLQKRRQKPAKGAKPRKGPDPAKAAEREQRRRDAAAKKLQQDAERQQAKLDRAVANEQKRRQQLADREARADAQAKRRLEVEARRAKRDADKLAREAKPKPGGGGGGSAKKPKPEADTSAAEDTKRTTNRETVAKVLGVDLGPLASLADGAALDPAAAADFERRGLVARQSDGSYTTTASGRTLLRAAERGDERQARAMLQRGQELRTTADTRAAGRAERQAERERTRDKPGGRYKSSLAVFKDHTGRYRWLAVSSTAFKDRDGEIVSVAALQKDVARTDASGNYGPLRWWHVPGLDIGDCDFRAVHGRSLIESGTFRDDRYAQAIKEKDQVSLGFLHPLPDPAAVPIFEDIVTFERSVVPFPEGRGSNLFTRLVVKEAQMLTEAKKAALASRVGPDILAELLSQVESTEKAADQAGVAYKSAQRVAVWDEAAGAWSEVVAKADLPSELEAKAEGGEVLVDEEIIEDEPLDEAPAGEFMGDMAPDEFFARQAEALQTVLAPLIEALNIESKMRGVVEEVKGITANYQTTKENADAARAQEVATLAQQIETLKAEQATAAAKLKELAGDQPAGISGGYRASLHGPAPTLPALKESAPSVDPAFANFFSFGQPQ